MSTRDVRIGKVCGKSSYELAVEAGLFSGTLTEYINKEQKYYNDMVSYGNELKKQLGSTSKPVNNYKKYSVLNPNEYIANNTKTRVFYKKIERDAFVDISASISLYSVNLVTDGIIEIALNDEVVAFAPVVSNIYHVYANILCNKDDTIDIYLTQISNSSKKVKNSVINMTERERG